MASATPSISQDASSLRAAALLTIKAKAKRTHPSAEANHQQEDASSVASTRRAAPSPELNYGSDDGLADAEGSTEEEEEEGGEKEEGEISDDDAAVAAKHTNIMMDVDNEPLPGLNSSSDRFQVSESMTSMTFSETKASNPPSHQQNYPESRIASNKSTPPDAQSSAPPLMHSIIIAKPSDASKNLSLISSSSSHLSGQSGATVSRSRGLSVEHPVPAVPPSSSGLKMQFSNNDMPSQRDIPNGGGDRMGPAAPSDLPSSAVPAPSRQLLPETSRPLVDHAHARPSMKMTIQEFMEAKTIILDLLGWGVPSEYFINCGLTREAIFYAFTEMNLKLPANLNTDGIIPYGPPQSHTPLPNHVSEPTSPVIHQLPQHLSGLAGDNGFASDRPPFQLSGQTKSGTASYTAPHPLPPKPKRAPSPPTSPVSYESVRNQTVSQQGSSQIGSSTSYPGNGSAVNNGYIPRPTSASQGGSSLSGLHGQHTTRTPSAPSGITKQSPSTRPALPVKPSSSRPEVPAQQNLDDLETLRRQELLARKAVLASRKPKPVVSGSTAPTPNQNPPRSKSPSTSSLSTPNDKAPVPPELVDDFLNSIAHPNPSDSTTHPLLTHSPDSIDMEIGIRSPEDEGPTLSGMDPTFHGGSHSYASHNTAFPLRKGSNKRPVASDFVDYDVHPSKRGSPFASSPTYNGGSSSSGRSQERLVSTPSFSGLPPSWKVVIDFSDTEDEDGVEPRPSDTEVSKSIATPNFSRRSASVGVPTPESKSPAPPPGVNPIAPAALLAKEQEIKRMKELIAERELNRLRKLLHAPKGTTPRGSQSPAPPTASVHAPEPTPGEFETSSSTAIVKQEEATDAALPLQPRLEGDGLSNSVSVDIQDEDAVMNDIFTRDQSADMSTTSTPPCTDSVVGDLEIAVTGEQVLTAEAGHEQVMDSKIVEASDETQIQDIPFPVISLVSEEHEAPSKQHISKRFSAYTSPLSYFASFRSHTQLDSILNTSSSSSSSNPNISSFTSSIPHSVDTPISQQVPTLLRPLKEATLLKLDPKRSICQFEIPGAGKCRDQTCQNVHLRAFEPNDDEIARHLAKALPAPRPTVQGVKAALSSVRASSKQELDLDARVSQVLLHLGVR